MPEIVNVQLIVGLEVHVELATRTKMFSRVPNSAAPGMEAAEPNTLIDPVVLGLPGALPVMNLAAVEMSMMVGMAGCVSTDQPASAMARRHMPKGISPRGSGSRPMGLGLRQCATGSQLRPDMMPASITHSSGRLISQSAGRLRTRCCAAGIM